MTSASSILDDLPSNIANADMPEADKDKLLHNFTRFKMQTINLMFVGAVGCGKSSTINALLKDDQARVGTGSEPETLSIQKYQCGNLIFWDTPGLDNEQESDTGVAKDIIAKLHEKDQAGNPLIDFVVLVLDGGSRDLGASYNLLNKIIVPNLGEYKENRIVAAINQADLAMKGRNWDQENNKPEPLLLKFLEDKVISVRERIKEGTGIDVEPIYYSAGFKDPDGPQPPSYNILQLLFYIVNHTPEKQQQVVATNSDSGSSINNGDESKKRGLFSSIVRFFTSLFTSK